LRARQQRSVKLNHLASKIQGLYKIAADRVRCFYVRIDVAQYRIDKSMRNALHLQRIIRGHLARRRAARMLHAAYVRRGVIRCAGRCTARMAGMRPVLVTRRCCHERVNCCCDVRRVLCCL
jgi:hypothetical protein